MRLRENILDKAVVIGLLMTCGSLLVGFLAPSMWQIVLWPSYLVSKIYPPNTEDQKLICDVASVIVGIPAYSLVTYACLYVYSRFK
jgi:hypothetical protein